MKEQLVRLMPFIVPVHRLLHAVRGALAHRDTARGQNGEDKIVEGILSSAGIENGVYLDVGSNHPTKLSNTYRFYRKGWSGILVEPNQSYRWLYRMFRPRDTVVNIGIANESGILPFYHQTWAVLSGFGQQSADGAKSVDYTPVLPLDSLLSLVQSPLIALMSIDVEGLNYDVLLSGRKLLEKTYVVIVEFGDEEDKIVSLLETAGFVLAERTVHNVIFKRSVPISE